MSLTATVNNAPYGLDLTSSRIALRGLLSFVADVDYVVGGLVPNLTLDAEGTLDGVLSPLVDASGQNVLFGAYTQPPAPINITGITVSSTTVVFLTANPPAAGKWVTLGGFTNVKSAPLNGVTVKVVSTSAGVSFTGTVTTTATTVTDNGTATVYVGPDELLINSVAGSGYVYTYNLANGTVQIFEASGDAGALVELTATTIPSPVVNDLITFLATYVRA